MDIKFPRNIFHSARLKLTLYSLGILLAISLTLTLSTRWLAQRAYEESGVIQRGEFYHLFVRTDDLYQPGLPYSPDQGIENIQETQETLVHQRLNQETIIINLITLVIGGALSYLFAGYVLQPIEEAHDNQKRFASDASHELRTPLANLRVENEVFLRQKDFKSDEAKALIVSNLEEVQRLENLASNLLAMTQYEHSDLKLSKISVKALTTEAIASVDKVAAAKKVSFKDMTSSATIIGHKGSLVELLAIILDNAVKYSPEGSSIELKGKSEGSHYKLSIHDQGSGIAEKDLPHIFERFYQGDKARSSNKGGYGLGLSLAVEISIANNAEIIARNHPKGGAEFSVLLPKK